MSHLAAQEPTLHSRLVAEGTAALAEAARERGDAVRGAILFPQRKIDCVKCHAAGGRALLGPDLTTLGADVTDSYLVESLLDPSKVIKKGYETVRVSTSAGRACRHFYVVGRNDVEIPARHRPCAGGSHV